MIIDEDDIWAQSIFNQEGIRSEISEVLAIPKWALTCELKPNPPYVGTFKLPNGKVLKPEQAITGN